MLPAAHRARMLRLSALDLNLTMCVPVPGLAPWRAAVRGGKTNLDINASGREASYLFPGPPVCHSLLEQNPVSGLGTSRFQLEWKEVNLNLDSTFDPNPVLQQHSYACAQDARFLEKEIWI